MISGYADEVTNLIIDALEQYKKCDYVEAANDLEYVSPLTLQKNKIRCNYPYQNSWTVG